MTATTQAPATVPPTNVPGSAPHTDGAWAPIQTRSERVTSYDPASFGLPTGREVNWKHTPIDRVAALFRDEAGPRGVMQVDVQAPAQLEQLFLRDGQAPRG